MVSVLYELQALRFAQPGPHAARGEVAAWYEQKATVLGHLADDSPEPESSGLRIQALGARLHAAELRSGVAA